MEYLARTMNAERMRRYEDAQCPQAFCRQEYRDLRPCGKPVPLRSI